MGFNSGFKGLTCVLFMMVRVVGFQEAEMSYSTTVTNVHT